MIGGNIPPDGISGQMVGKRIGGNGHRKIPNNGDMLPTGKSDQTVGSRHRQDLLTIAGTLTGLTGLRASRTDGALDPRIEPVLGGDKKIGTIRNGEGYGLTARSYFSV